MPSRILPLASPCSRPRCVERQRKIDLEERSFRQQGSHGAVPAIVLSDLEELWQGHSALTGSVYHRMA